MRKYGESKTTRIMMATVPHVTSGLGLRKFQANGFLLTRVYKEALLWGRPSYYGRWRRCNGKCVIAGGTCLLYMMTATPHLTQRFFGHSWELKIKRIRRVKRVARREESWGKLMLSAYDRCKGPSVGPKANLGVSEKREKVSCPYRESNHDSSVVQVIAQSL